MEFSAEALANFFDESLSLYGASRKNIIFIVGDNCATNRTLSKITNIPFIGCASRRFNLAVQLWLRSYEYLLAKVAKVMVQLRTLKQAALLQTKTPLKPVYRNVTRWSGNHAMLKRFF
eukprot:1395348-Amorphochlora_amoeboformis.AAC.3